MRDAKSNQAASQSELVWIKSATGLVMQAEGGDVVLQEMACNDSQQWLVDDEGVFTNKQTCTVLTGGAGRVVLSERGSPSLEDQQWSLTRNLGFTNTRNLFCKVPNEAKPGQDIDLVEDLSTPVSVGEVWQILPVPDPPEKSKHRNDLNDYLESDYFYLKSVETGKVLGSSGRTMRQGAFIPEMQDPTGSANQLWRHEKPNGRLINKKGLVLGYYPLTEAGVFCFSSDVGPYQPDICNTWYYNDGVIWNAAVFDTPEHKGDVLLAARDVPALENYNPLSRLQNWGIEVIGCERTVVRRTTEEVLQSTPKISVKLETAGAIFAGTLADIYVSAYAGKKEVASGAVYGGLGRAGKTTCALPLKEGARLSGPQELTEIHLSISLVWIGGISIEDEWKCKKLTVIVDDKAYNYLAPNSWIDFLGKHVTIPLDGWEDSENFPVDMDACTFEVRWPQYIIDCMPYVGFSRTPPFLYLRELDKFPWGRGYDPEKIEGIGMLTGVVRGNIVGNLLATEQCEVLRDGWYTYAYSRLSDAIVYKYFSADHVTPADYVRHSQLGSGDEVVMAGEFKIETGYNMKSVVVEVNNSSGHYKPGTYQCLYWVQQKLERLGIEVEDIKWWTPS